MSFPTREGYLQKYRNKLAGWDSRYFKLDRSYLHYFEAKDSPRPKKTVIRTDIVTVNEYTGSTDRQKCMEIVIKNSDKWIVQCHSEFEMKEWGKALVAHIPEYDLRRPQWLSDRPIEPPSLEVPTMPQYMSSAEDPPSYRSASQMQGTDPSAPYKS